MQAMMLETEAELNEVKQIGNLDRILTDFAKRAQDFAFPTTKFSIYMNFSIFYHQQPELAWQLMRYGADELFPKLPWNDRIALLEAMKKFELPFSDKYALRLALQLLIDPYHEIII